MKSSFLVPLPHKLGRSPAYTLKGVNHERCRFQRGSGDLSVACLIGFVVHKGKCRFVLRAGRETFPGDFFPARTDFREKTVPRRAQIHFGDVHPVRNSDGLSIEIGAAGDDDVGSVRRSHRLAAEIEGLQQIMRHKHARV